MARLIAWAEIVDKCCFDMLAAIPDYGWTTNDVICNCGQAWERKDRNHDWTRTSRAKATVEPAPDGQVRFTLTVSIEDALMIPVMLVAAADPRGDADPEKALYRKAAHAIREAIGGALGAMLKPMFEAERQRRMVERNMG